MEQNGSITPKNGVYFTRLDFENSPTAQITAIFDECVRAVFDGTIQMGKPPFRKNYANPDCFKVSGGLLLPVFTLEYYLDSLMHGSFNYDKAFEFSEIFRKKFGWNEISYTLEIWFKRNVAKIAKYQTKWSRALPAFEEFEESAKIDIFRFACYTAVCNMKYGPSYASITANEIFDKITEMGSDLPAKLKKSGSGTIAKEITEYKDAEISCKANDVFATIKIAIKNESELNYAKALDFLCALLQAEFPRSYVIDFRCLEKSVLPIKGLQKSGVHLFFANAVRYPALHTKIESYARLAIRQYEWYINLENEQCAMPGTFAVFALGLTDAKYTKLLLHYLNQCDDEHSSIQGKFLAAYIDKFGFTDLTALVFVKGANSMQNLEPNKIFYAKAMSKNALESLLKIRESEKANKYAWEAVLYAIFGKKAIDNSGAEIIKNAGELKPLLELIFAKTDR